MVEKEASNKLLSTSARLCIDPLKRDDTRQSTRNRDVYKKNGGREGNEGKRCSSYETREPGVFWCVCEHLMDRFR